MQGCKELTDDCLVKTDAKIAERDYSLSGNPAINRFPRRPVVLRPLLSKGVPFSNSTNPGTAILGVSMSRVPAWERGTKEASIRRTMSLNLGIFEPISLARVAANGRRKTASLLT